MMTFRQTNNDKSNDDKMNHTGMNKLSLALLGLLISPLSLASALNVILPAEQIALNYEQPVRLEQVFKDAIAQSKTTSPTEYLLANKLFNLDKAEQSEQLKQQVLDQLNALQLKNQKYKTSSDILTNQIESWEVSYREDLNLDFDVIRTQPSANPMLSGDFALVSEKRSSWISVEGVMSKPQNLKFKSHLNLHDYIGQVDSLSSANPSYAWVIYPDGNTVRAGYAQWNEESIQLTPNTVVFLGFDSDSGNTLELEKQIVKLITMRTNTK